MEEDPELAKASAENETKDQEMTDAKNDAENSENDAEEKDKNGETKSPSENGDN